MVAVGGAALGVFNDFMRGTGPAIDSGEEDIIVEVLQNTWTLHRMTKGKGPDELFSGGAYLRDDLIFDPVVTRRHYKPNATFLWSNPQVLEGWRIDWRFTIDHMSWTKQEIALQVNRGMTRGARFQVYKKVRKAKLKRLRVGAALGWEADLWATPNFDEMEGTEGYRPYSLACFLNQQNPEGWATLQGVNLSTHPQWACQRIGVNLNTDDGTNQWAGWSAFDVAFQIARFDKIPLAERDSEPMTTPNVIFCSLWGNTMYMRNMRASNDRFVMQSSQDPAYMRPHFNGIPLEPLTELESAEIWPANGGGYAGEQGADITGPRFMGAQLGYVGPVFHEDVYMEQDEPVRHPNQPGSWVQPVDTWWNIRARSLQRHFCLYPTVDVTKPTYVRSA